MNEEQTEQLGRLLGRMHLVGKSKTASHRLSLTPQVYGELNLNYLLEAQCIPGHIEDDYKKQAQQIIQHIIPLFEGVTTQRIHGDCHWGNILWHHQNGPSFLDFDDMVVGPAVQDIWLIIAGRDQEARIQREILIEGYNTMNSFDRRQLILIEPLRTLRFIHFSAWISRRWEDPSFKNAFPQFDSEHYWQIQLKDLQEQWLLIKDAEHY